MIAGSLELEVQDLKTKDEGDSIAQQSYNKSIRRKKQHISHTISSQHSELFVTNEVTEGA